MRYNHCTCPVCGQVFTDSDDVVVCPDCGTPHHRACWSVTGLCANTSLHTEGYSFDLPDNTSAHEQDACVSAEEEISDDALSTDLPNGEITDSRNDDSAYNGEYSGNSERNVNGEYNNNGERNVNGEQGANGSSYGFPSGYDRGFGYFAGKPIEPQDNIGGITAAEYGAYTGRGAHSYVPRFMFLEKTGKKVIWNIFAFLFPFTWAAYKRMYALAAVLLAVSFGFSALSAYSMSTTQGAKELYSQYMQATQDGVVTDEELSQLTSAYSLVIEPTSSSADEGMASKVVSFLLNFRIFDNIVLGLLATFIYMNDAKKRITGLRNANVPQEIYYTALHRMGRGSVFFIASGYVVMFLQSALMLDGFLGS